MSKKNHGTEPEAIENDAVPTGEDAVQEEATQQAEPTAEELLEQEKEKHLRLAAEFDNYRKRTVKEREALFTAVRADTVFQLLPVYDNLERALNQKTQDEAFYKGIELTMVQLREIFEKMGVKPIEALGQKFDANFHNAVMHIDDEAYSENEIVEEFQKGFTLGDKVIRFSMVKVAN